MKPIEKTDPFTGETFIAFRANQVFASDENRIRYNNLKAKELRESKSEIDKPLLINFRILNELMAGKKEEVFHKQFLLGRGYSFLVLTHYEELNGKGFMAVYNFIIVPQEGDKIKIVRK
jgi:hypothetical protein